MPAEQPEIVSFQPPHPLPEGFRFCDGVITEAEEASLVRHIEVLPFQQFQFRGYEGKRRVVSFGWRYDFADRKLFAAEPIPSFLTELYDRVVASSGFTMREVQQVLVTEYQPGASIGWHKDRPVFGEVTGVSLVSPCTFRLRRAAGVGWQRVSVQAAPRSAYYLEGPARSEWEHSIPAVQNLRYSVTFRKVRRRVRP